MKKQSQNNSLLPSSYNLISLLLLAACSPGGGVRRPVVPEPTPADIRQIAFTKAVHLDGIIVGEDESGTIVRLGSEIVVKDDSIIIVPIGDPFSYTPLLTEPLQPSFNLEFKLFDNPDFDPENSEDDNDARFFTINETTGKIEFKADHISSIHLKSSYSLIITASYNSADGKVELSQEVNINVIRPGPAAITIEGDDATDDVLQAQKGNDALFGRAGDDVLISGVGENHMDGGKGRDTASYEAARAGVTVEAARVGVTVDLAQRPEEDGSILLGSEAGRDAQNDTLVSIENLRGSAFDDTLSGDWRGNVIEGGGGADTLSGGGGADSLSYRSAAAGVIVDLSQATDEAGFAAVGGAQDTESYGDKVKGFKTLLGSDFDDRLTGEHNDNIIEGHEGNDRLSGGGGNDQLFGGNGNDTLYGGLGHNRLTGGAGADIFHLQANLSGGFDIITDFVASSDKLQLIVPDKAASFATVTKLLEAAKLTISYASDANGILTATISYDGAAPSSASDDYAVVQILNLSAQLTVSDFVLREASDIGAEALLIHHVALTDSTLIGSDGYDVASFATASSGISVIFDEDDVHYVHKDGTARTTLTAIDAIEGSDYGDVIAGTGGNNQLWGRDGDDMIAGNGGDDALYGGAGDDRLDGGSGADRLDGGSGTNHLTGGAGSDLFIVRQKGGNGDDVIVTGGGRDVVIGGAGNDTILFGTIDNLASYSGQETLIYRIDSTNENWSTVDGYDSVQNFELGTDKLLLVDVNATGISSLDDFVESFSEDHFISFTESTTSEGAVSELRYEVFGESNGFSLTFSEDVSDDLSTKLLAASFGEDGTVSDNAKALLAELFVLSSDDSQTTFGITNDTSPVDIDII